MDKPIKKIAIVWWCLYILLIFSISFCVILNVLSKIYLQQDSNKEMTRTYAFADVPVSIGGNIQQQKKISQLLISIKNNKKYTISAVKFLVECYNVYGEYLQYADRKYIYQEYYIQGGESNKAVCDIPKSVKSVRIYVYSVYYKNNCYVEWGYRNLSAQEIKNFAPMVYIECEY